MERQGDKCGATLGNTQHAIAGLDYGASWLVPDVRELRALFCSQPLNAAGRCADSGVPPTPKDCGTNPGCVPNEPYDRLKKLGVRYKVNGEERKGDQMYFWLSGDSLSR